jgi:uncharacterized protein (UPF0332 family)
MIERESPRLLKAWECLAGAESELASQRYNNAANRAYYAVFHAAIAALQQAGIRPPGADWSHGFVAAQFDGQLIYRRKLYSTALRGVLRENGTLRSGADYGEEPVTRTEASRAMRRSRSFVAAIQARRDQPR